MFFTPYFTSIVSRHAAGSLFAERPRPPLMRAGRVMRDAGYSGFSRVGRKYAIATLSFVSSALRNGFGSPAAGGRERRNVHAPTPTAAATPIVRKPRRVAPRSSASTARSFSAIAVARAAAIASSSTSSISGTSPAASDSGGTGTGISSVIRHLVQLVPGHHGPEVVPTGAHDLRDVDEEERDVADRQPEMDEARRLVAAHQRRQPRELHRLVDGHAAEQRTEAHDHDGGVGDLLRAVVFPDRRRLLAQMEIVQRDLDGLDERAPVRHEVAPFAGDDRV